METIKTKMNIDIVLRENEEKWILYSLVNWEDFSRTYDKKVYKKENAIWHFEKLILEANKIFRLEQKKYIWMYVKEVFTNKPMILLEYNPRDNWEGNIINDVITFSSDDPNDHWDSHHFYCDFSHISWIINEIKWHFLKDLWVKRVQDWFILSFYIVEWYWKENKNKEIKVYISAYSDYDSYYSDDVSIVVYKWTELILESIAENSWWSYTFNSSLKLDKEWNLKEEKKK